jgi:uncharacterized protein (TIGR04255 family)
MQHLSRKPLSKSPLSLVLCQIRFSTIRDMATRVTSVQERLRKEGYRLDLSTKIQSIALGAPVPQAPQVLDRWEFLNVTKTRSVVLTEQFAAYQTSDYARFEEFVPEVVRLMDALAATGADILTTRVGLRYVNAIVAGAGKTWRDYVVPGLHGPSASVLSDPLTAHHLFGETSHGRMVARLHQNSEGMLVPVELAATNLALRQQAPPAGTTVTMIDIDHFKEWSTGFAEYDPEQLRKQLTGLKEDVYEVFRSFVTDLAITTWT